VDAINWNDNTLMNLYKNTNNSIDFIYTHNNVIVQPLRGSLHKRGWLNYLCVYNGSFWVSLGPSKSCLHNHFNTGMIKRKYFDTKITCQSKAENNALGWVDYLALRGIWFDCHTPLKYNLKLIFIYYSITCIFVINII